MKWLKNNLIWLLSVAFALMTLTVFGPIELYLTNSAEFWFGMPEMLKISGILTACAGLVLLAVGLLLPKCAKSWYAAILFVAALCMYIQGNFLNISYGVLDGRTIDWGAYGKYAVINTVCWVAAIALLILLHKKKPELFARIIKLASLFMIAVQVLTLGVLFVSNDTRSEKSSLRLTTDHMTEVGSEDNIVLFILDSFDDPLMDSFMETDGEQYQTLLQDFTRFTDCAAGGATTATALPILVSGEYYTDGLSFSEYVNGAFNADGLYDALREQGYSINMYTNGLYVGDSAAGYVDNFVEEEGEPSSYGGLTAKYASFTLFKYMPHILKQYFWVYTAEFAEYIPSRNYTEDDVAFYNALVETPLQTAGEKSFHLFHLTGPHYPYTMNEYAQPDAEATREQQAKGSLYIVEEYLDQMKACGVYDDAMIIITADHGDSEHYSAPILFVKDRGTTGAYEENDAPVSHLDLHATIFSYLGEEKGETVFEISETEARERVFHLRLQDAGSFYIKEFVIRDKVDAVGNGTETGNILKPSNESGAVVMGEKMTLGMDGEGNQYIVSGVEVWPLDSVVTSGAETVFSFDLGRQLTEDLPVEIEVLRLYDNPNAQNVQVYANGTLCHEEAVTGAQTIAFTVPAEALNDTTLELKLVLSNQWRPLYLSGVTLGANEKGSIVDIIAIPLTALMAFCYKLVDNYVLAIVGFTLLTKIILLPVSIWVHKNGIAMVRLMPELNRLKIKHFGDKETIAEEQQKLYKRMHYSPFVSTIPMILQIVLLMGVIGAVKALLADDPGSMLNLMPSQARGVTLLMPLGAGLAALCLSLSQNKISPLQREQVAAEQISTSVISVGISLFLGAFVSLGTGVYWIASNLLSIAQQLFLNWLVKPAKYVDYAALEESRKELETMSSLGTAISKEDKRREKEDYKRFFSVANKHLVFYSEKSGFYKYFQNAIEYMLSHSNIIVHYVTNDPKDQIFELAKQQPRIRPYYIGPKKIITLMMKMDAKIVVMTTPDLENYYIKRSYVRKDVEYIYLCHGMMSTNMCMRKGAYDHFDTIMCVGQHQIDEIRETEQMYKLQKKTLVPCGYSLLDNLIAAYDKMPKTENEKKNILIAPSWQEGNILESCIEELVEQLYGDDHFLVVRPHPEFIKRFPGKMEQLAAKFRELDPAQFRLETDFSSNVTIYTADTVITDWSGIAQEFAFTTLRPVLLINTPMKVLNPEYTKYQNAPLDITLREELGKTLDLDKMSQAGETVAELFANRAHYEEKLREIRSRCVFHIGKSGAAAGRYILQQASKADKDKT